MHESQPQETKSPISSSLNPNELFETNDLRRSVFQFGCELKSA